MVKTSVSSRVLSVALAAALTCTLVPAQGLAFADDSDNTPMESAENSASDEATVTDEGVALEGDLQANAESRVNEDVALEQSDSTNQDQPSEGMPAQETAAIDGAANGAPVVSDDIEITRTSVSLSDQVTTVFSYNGLVFSVNADDPDTASCIDWTGNAPEGELQVPAQAVAGSKVYPVTRIEAVGGGFTDTQIDDVAEDPENVSDVVDGSTNTESVENDAQSADASAVAPNPYATDIYADAQKALGVTAITIPASVESIDPAFFQMFPNATNVSVANDNPIYKSYNGMLLNEELTDLLLVPEGMEGAAVLPDSLASVPAYVISRCKKLSGLSFKSGSNGTASFAAWNGILYTNDLSTLIAAPAGLGASATIAPECQVISEGAFWGNENLKTIVASGNVSEIAFGDLPIAGGSIDTAVESVSAFMPAVIDSATVVTDNTSVWEEAGFKNFASPVQPGEEVASDGFAYTLLEDYTLSVAWAGEGEIPSELNIPATAQIDGIEYAVSHVAESGFKGQPIRTLSVPNGVTTIGNEAFAGCSSLESVTLAGSVIAIGTSAFQECAALSTVNMGAGIQTIGESAFDSTGISEVVLPTSVKTVESNAFANCSNLKAIIAMSEIANVSDTALANTTGVNIYIPYNANSARTWNVGPVASANHLQQYGVKTAQETYEITPLSEVNVFDNGGYLEAPADIEASISYKANTVSADTTGAIKAHQPGTTPVTFTLAYKDIQLAKSSTSIVVSNPHANKDEESSEDADEEGENNEEMGVNNVDSNEESDTLEIIPEILNMDVQLDQSPESINGPSSELAITGNLLSFVNTMSNAGIMTTSSFSTATLNFSRPAGVRYTVQWCNTKNGSWTLAKNSSTGEVVNAMDWPTTGVSSKTLTHIGNVDANDNGIVSFMGFNASGGTIHSYAGQQAVKNFIGAANYITPQGTNASKLSKPTNDYFAISIKAFKTGYTFKSWTNTKSGSSSTISANESLSAQTLNGHTLTPNFVPNTYKISFNNDGGTNTPSGFNQKYDASISAINLSGIYAPKKTGYTFDGYYTGEKGTGTKYFNGDGSVALSTNKYTHPDNLTLYANWIPEKYDIVLHHQNPSNDITTLTSKAVYGSALPASATKPSGRDHYTFDGYYTERYGDGTKYYDSDGNRTSTAPAKYEQQKNLDLYANWVGDKFTVRFDVNGGTTSSAIENAEITVEYGKLMPDLSFYAPKRDGYTFVGWYSSSSGGSAAIDGTRYYDENQRPIRAWYETSDITLYAHWGYKVNIVYPTGFYWGAEKCTPIETYLDQAYRRVSGGGDGFVFSGYLGDYEPVGLTGAPLSTASGNPNISIYFNKDGSPTHYPRPSNNQTLYAIYKRSGISLDGNRGTLGTLESTTALITASGPNSNRNVVCYGRLGYAHPGYGVAYIGDASWGDDWSPTLAYNKFNGFWDSSTKGAGTKYISAAGPGRNLCVALPEGTDAPTTLYAQWDYARYTIYYNKNNTGASGTIDSHYAYMGTDPTIKKCTFAAPKGMHFTGWNTVAKPTTASPGKPVSGSTEKDTVYEGDLSTTNGGSVTLYAQWANNTYKISYKANGGSGSAMTDSNAEYGTSPTIAQCTYTAPSNQYYFKGWNTKSDGSGTAVTGSTTGTTTYSGNLTDEHEATVDLYAQWEPYVYTIELTNKDADSGKAGDTAVYLKYGVGYYSKSTCKDTEAITKLSKTPQQEGYTFGGYPGLTDDSGNITAGNTDFKESKLAKDKKALDPSWKAIKLTIQLKPNYPNAKEPAVNVEFTYDDIKHNEKSTTADKDKKRIPANTFKRDWYEFNDWDTDANGGGTAISDNSVITRAMGKLALGQTSHVAPLFAQWTQTTFNIFYETNGGTSIKRGEGVKNNLITAPDPGTKRDGYTFSGWYKDEELKNKWDFAKDKMPAEDLTLYAGWTANKFKVVLHPGKGEGTPKEYEFTYAAENQTLPNFDRELGFKRTGGTFKGWTLDENPSSDAKYWVNMADVATGLSYGDNVTLYAQWDPIPYTIVYFANAPADSQVDNPNAMGLESFTYKFPEDTSEYPTLKPNAFTCPGYEFMGWNTQSRPDGGADDHSYADKGQLDSWLNDRAVTAPANLVILYAQWRGEEYEIGFNPNVPEGESVEGTMENQHVYWGLAARLNLNQFKRPGGWIFAGWNTEPDGSGVSYLDGGSIINLRPREGDSIPTLYAQWEVSFDVTVPTVDHINVTMNDQGEWIMVDGANIKMESRSPLPVGIRGVSLEGNEENLGKILEDVNKADQLVLNVSAQNKTVPLSIGTTSTDSNFYFRLEKGSVEKPATLPLEFGLETRDPSMRLKEHTSSIPAFKLTFELGVVRS